MNKIKITEKQARMLKELGKPKVMKVTKEQYDKIVELEKVYKEGLDSVGKEMVKQAEPMDRPQFSRDLKSALKEVDAMYNEFVSELYDINETSEKKYESLCKLMEMNGLIDSGRIVKEKFGGSKERVKEVICAGLKELNDGNSHYKAMEAIEEALNNPEGVMFGDDVEIDGERKDALESLADREARDKEEMNEDNQEEEIVGSEILKHLPASELPNYREQVNWSDRKDIRLPSLTDGDAISQLFSKEEVVNYIKEFKQRFNEEPSFILNPDGAWYEKVIVTNNEFNKWRQGYKDLKSSQLGDNTTDETTTAASSGAYVGGMSSGNAHDFNADEITEMSVDMDSIFNNAIDLLNDIIPSENVKPSEVLSKKDEIGKVMTLFGEIPEESRPWALNFLPKAFSRLLRLARASVEGERNSFVNYIDELKNLKMALKVLKRKGHQFEATTTVSVGGDSGTFAYDAPAGNGSDFWTAGNKENKKKSKINESSINIDALTQAVNQTLSKFDESLSYTDFATVVANILKNEYGSHNFTPFLDALIEQLPLNLKEDAKNETQWYGGSFVKVKDACKTYPYCNAGPEAIETKKTKSSVISKDHN